MRRFSIAALMLVVLVSAVAVAALRDASDTWAGILLLLTLLLLGIAVLGVLHRREAKRAFWQGFALFGWGYLVMAQAPWFAEQVGPKLPTTHLLDYAHGKLNPSPNLKSTFKVALTNQVATINGQLTGGATRLPPVTLSTPVVTPQPGTTILTEDVVGLAQPAQPATFSYSFILAGAGNLEQFQRVGHCLFALLAALLGGLVARWFERTNREPAAA